MGEVKAGRTRRGKVLGLFYPQIIVRKWYLRPGRGEGVGFARRRLPVDR
jgi:hypothetical protein